MEHTINQEQLLDWYMNDILSGKELKNIFQFCQMHDIAESDFYNYYGSFDAIEAHFFELLVEKTVDTLFNTEEYMHFTPQEKLLSFYYTFFGNMTANRSFVLYLLRGKNMESMKKLASLRKSFKTYIKTLDIEKLDLKQKELLRLQDKAVEESAWIQLMATIKFWMDDDSPRFEKTDIFIEKGLNASFELVNVQAFKKITDFGKFLIKEMRN